MAVYSIVTFVCLVYLQSIGGYTYSFVTSPPARCICKLCNRVVCEAYQHNSIGCGNVFCKDCVDQHKKNFAWNPCPSCRVAFSENNTVKDARMDNEVNDFDTKCLNKDQGCKWKAKLKYINNHLDVCLYHNVECTRGCNGMIQRGHLDRHLTKECPKRSHECSHCHEVGEHQYITGPGHLDICSAAPVPCSICMKNVKRKMMYTHKIECRLEPVPCQYQSVGCTARPRRQDIPQHNLEAMSDHLQLAVQAITQQRTEIAQLRREQQVVKKTLFSMGKLTSVILKMENVFKFQTAKTVKGRTWYSSNFFTNSTMGYTARLRVDINGAGEDSKFASCYICVTAGEYAPYLEWPFKGTFTVSILDQSKDGGKDYSKYLTSLSDSQPSKKNEVIIGEKEFMLFKKLLEYLKSNCLFFKVTVNSVYSEISQDMSCIK